MTREQAEAEFSRMCAEMGVNPRNLPAPQIAAWIRRLCELSYEWGRAAVTKVVNTWDRKDMPPVGFLSACADKVMSEGIPSAGAYSQDMKRDTWSKSDEAHYCLFVQMQISDGIMPLPVPDEPPLPESKETVDVETERHRADMRYWAYVYNTDGYRKRCQQVWRQQWASMGVAR